MTEETKTDDKINELEQKIKGLEPFLTATRLLSLGGFLLIFISCFLFAVAGYVIIYKMYPKFEPFYIPPNINNFDEMVMRMANHYLIHFLFPIVFIFLAILSFFLGYRALKAAASEPTRQADIQQDLLREILAGGKDSNDSTTCDKVCEAYIKFRSLGGVTGFFTTINLTGLPLATIGLTLIFTTFGLFTTDKDVSKVLFDLAKLTLGAFLGSYIQKQPQKESSEQVTQVKK